MFTLARTRRPRRSTGHGFTLIELMIGVAIIGILASIAYPSYMDQIKKGRRADAVQALSQLQLAQERYRANNPVYADNITTLGVSATTTGSYYTVAITGTPTGKSYTATATGLKSQAADTGCTVLTVTVNNGTAAYTPTACWSQ